MLGVILKWRSYIIINKRDDEGGGQKVLKVVWRQLYKTTP